MDDRHPVLDTAAAFLQGPHRHPAADLPTDFLPLRLVLQPDGPCVELVQPITLVGRHSDADIRLVQADVSRRHCRFVFEDSHWRIVDLNSLNGVYVNDERMQEASVYDGDQIRVGSAVFVARIGAAEQSAPTIAQRTADVLPLPQGERRAS